MKSKEKLLGRINSLIEIADILLSNLISPVNSMSKITVKREAFYELKASTLSLILNLYGDKHTNYMMFAGGVTSNTPSCVQTAKGILKSIQYEINNDWLVSFKGIVSAELFTDFIEMAEHLLSENYKDAAAVIIGSVLEEHLRQLCNKYNIELNEVKAGKTNIKKADRLNTELCQAGIYNLLDQKSVTAWLDLRNKAAHGKYSEYDSDQVKIMLDNVKNFIARNSL